MLAVERKGNYLSVANAARITNEYNLNVDIRAHKNLHRLAILSGFNISLAEEYPA